MALKKRVWDVQERVTTKLSFEPPERLLTLQEAVGASPVAGGGPSDQCFVSTRDCACEVSCDGSNAACGPAEGAFPETTHPRPSSTIAHLDDFYDAESASLVNQWAAADLGTLGYKVKFGDE